MNEDAPPQPTSRRASLGIADQQLLAGLRAKAGVSAPPVTIGGFTLGNLIGESPSSAVYESRDPKTEEPVAVKVLRTGPEHDTRSIERALATITASLEVDHPHVVKIRAAGVEADTLWLSMDLVRGRTLHDWQGDAELAWQDLLEIYTSVTDGLAALHTHGVIHGDVTPHHVLIGDDGIARLIGVGWAQISDVRGVPGGHPAYMAPEVYDDLERSERSDLFSLSVTMFEALTGTHPYSTWNFGTVQQLMTSRTTAVRPEAIKRSFYRHLFGQVEAGFVRWPPSSSALPEEVRHALHRGLRPDPEDRFESVQRFHEVAELGPSPAEVELPASTLTDEALRDALDDDSDDGPDDELMIANVLSATVGAEIAPTPTFGRFELLKKIGRGGMGTVYRAHDPKLGRDVALKVLNSAPGQEARALAKVSSNNVVKVWNTDSTDGKVWISMELVAGTTLRNWQNERQRSWSVLLDTYQAIGSGLAAVHEENLVHGDFKPDNILVDKHEVPKLTDFGLARIDGVGTRGGTPEYMAPEQFDGPPEKKSDQFSFALCLFEALTGAHPYTGYSYAEFADVERSRHPEATDLTIRARYSETLKSSMRQGELRLRRWPWRVPQHIRNALTRALSIDPSARFPSMTELLNALDRGRVRRRRILQAAGIVVGLGLTAGGTAYGINQQRLAECAAPEERYAEVWGPEQREELTAAHPEAAGQVGLVLDRYGQRWTEVHQEVCAQTVLEGEWSAWSGVSECLDQKLYDVGAVVDTLPESDKPLTEVYEISLFSPVSCALDIAVSPLPNTISDEQLDEIHVGFNEAFALEVGHKYTAGVERMGVLVEQTEALGYDPLQAEAYYRRGRLRVKQALYEDPTSQDGSRTPGIADLEHAELLAAGSFARSTFFDARIFRLKSLAVMGERDVDLPVLSRLLDDQRAELLETRGLYSYQRGKDDPSSEEGEQALKQSLDSYEEAIQLCTELENMVCRAKAQENKALAHIALGQFEQADRVLTEAIRFWTTYTDDSSDGEGYLPHLYTSQINTVMMLDTDRASKLVDTALERFKSRPDDQLPILMVGIPSQWGTPKAVELGRTAIGLLQAGAKASPRHELQLRQFALGALARSSNANTSLNELQAWTDAFEGLLIQNGEKYLSEALLSLSWSYIGRARLVLQEHEQARIALERAITEQPESGIDPLEHAHALLDLIDACIALEKQNQAATLHAKAATVIDLVAKEYGEDDSDTKALRARYQTQTNTLANN